MSVLGLEFIRLIDFVEKRVFEGLDIEFCKTNYIYLKTFNNKILPFF